MSRSLELNERPYQIVELATAKTGSQGKVRCQWDIKKRCPSDATEPSAVLGSSLPLPGGMYTPSMCVRAARAFLTRLSRLKIVLRFLTKQPCSQYFLARVPLPEGEEPEKDFNALTSP